MTAVVGNVYVAPPGQVVEHVVASNPTVPLKPTLTVFGVSVTPEILTEPPTAVIGTCARLAVPPGHVVRYAT